MKYSIVKAFQLPIIAGLVVLGAWCAEIHASGYELSRGRQVLLNRGLQLQALVWPHSPPFDLYPGVAEPSRWIESNFTTMNFFAGPTPYTTRLLAKLPAGSQWGRSNHNYGNTLTSEDEPYSDGFVGFCYEDEVVQTPAVQDEEKALFAYWKSQYPNALAYTNFWGTQLNASELGAYMRYTEPDMLMFDTYPGFAFPRAKRNEWYSSMQLYRVAGLGGIDGTGRKPIPYAQYLDLYRNSITDPIPSESFVRLQQNASWAFGYTFVSAFVYDNWSPDPGVNSAMFDSPGDSSPNAAFYYVKEANRQSRNLGPALIRMVSTGIYMKPGSGKSVWGTGLTEWSARAGTTVDCPDYITSITPTVSQGGAIDTAFNDILVGYFNPLLSNNSRYTFVDGLHFMIVNGSASGTADESAQWYHIMFDFAGSDFNSLVRLSRDTGKVEWVPLTFAGGTTYSLDLNLPGGTGDLFGFWNSANALPTIPEPSTWSLLCISGAAVLLWRKRTHIVRSIG